MSVEVPPADSAPVVGWGPRAFYGGVVESAPFEARFELILVSTGRRGVSREEERITGTIYRDSAGRVRREYRTQISTGEALELALIVDLGARTVVALDIGAKAATRFIDFGPPPGDALSEGWGFMGPWSDEAEADQRIIEGVACRKLRPEAWPLGSALDPKVAGEIWVSDELKFSVLERVSDSGREHTWRLYNIERTEPASSLFVVPAGYTEVVRSKFSDAPPKL